MESSEILYVTLALGAATLGTKLLTIGKRDKHLPPGPPTVPVLGNAHLEPAGYTHFKYAEWARQYGGIFSLKRFDSTVVVISDATVLKEFMDKRSVETSGRPHQYLIELMTGGNVILDLDTTSETWRAHRRAMRTLLAPKAVKDFQPIMVAESAQLLVDMMQSPKDYAKHVGRYNYSLVLSVGYGKRCLPFWRDGGEEPALFRGLKAFSKTVNEAPPLDDLPFLKYVPKPWAAWKEAYKHVKALQSGLYFGLMEEVERRLAAGDTNGCFFEDVLTKYQAEYQMTREVTA